MKDIMVDIETFGTDSNAVIVSISAVKFDLVTGQIGEMFEYALDMKEQVKNGAIMDADTVMWWLSQSKEAQDMLTNLNKDTVYVVLKEFNAFCIDTNGIWGNGATFDNVIIRNLYARSGIPFVVGFWADRDVRTLVALADIDTSIYKFLGTKHNGIDDCLHQINYCHQAYNMLKG